MLAAKPNAPLPSSVAFDGRHFLLTSSSSRRRHSLGVSSASHAAAVMLGLLQNTEQPLKHLSPLAERGAQKSRQLLVSSVLHAIGRVAVSEGHLMSSCLSDALKYRETSQAVSQPLEGSCTLSAGTILSDILLPATQESPADMAASRAHRSAVISGGLSGLGLLSSIWMTELDCTSLLLLGRSGRTELKPQPPL